MFPYRFVGAKVWLAVMLAAGAPTAANAAVDPNSCNESYSVLTVNGIRVPASDAPIYSVRTRGLLSGNAAFGGKPVNFDFIYNHTDGTAQDLLEVYAQKIAESRLATWSQFFDWLDGSLQDTALNDALNRYLTTDGATRDRALRNLLESSMAFTDDVVVKSAGIVQTKLAAGNRVLLVSHSQGNLYSNAAYGYLQRNNATGLNLRAVGMAGVADPAASVATGDGYVTNIHDVVVNALRLLSSALPANDTSVPLAPAADRVGHSYLDIYTSRAFPGIRAHVISTAAATVARLAAETPSANTNGPITATLTWNSPGDVDLHVYEPSGTHVFYANRGGQVGYLDRDDTVGTGPEHYYTSCTALAVGRYQVGVNYYSGTGSRVATVRIAAFGLTYPDRSTTLPVARSSSGNNSPVPLFNVVVAKDAEGNFSAEIQ